MSIIETQKRLLKESILKKKMQEGIRPNLLDIEFDIQKIFEKKEAGLPRFEVREMKKGQASNSEDYNSMFSAAADDLHVGFEEVRQLNNRMMSLTSYYESSRIKITKLLQELKLKTDALHMKVSEQSRKEIVGDLINNFLQVDFKGNESKNIPKTTAFVNLAHGDIEMKRQRNGTLKHDLSDAVPRFTTDADQFIALSPFDSAFTDTIHDGWRSILVTKEPREVKFELTLDLKEEIQVSNVTLDMQNGKPCYVTLYISEDGQEFVKLERMKIISSYQWLFESRELKAVRFEIIKKEEDRPNGNEYEYLLGIKHLQLSETLYEEESIFVSEPHLLNLTAVKKIELEADDYIAPHTSIRYYVGFDQKDNMIEWQEIQKDKPIITDMVKPYSTEINRYTEGYSDFMFERFGRKYHRIAKLPHRPIEGTMDLMLGRNMWMRETMPAPFTYDPTNDESDRIVYQTGVHDWLRAMSTKKEYVRVQTGFDYLKTNRFHRYTTYVQSDAPETIVGTFRGTKETSHAVFVNSNQIKGMNDQYTFTLSKGWNKIEVYAYAREINQELILDFYAPNMNYQIFANNMPLKEVSLYDLLNNTSSRIHSHFAVDEDNNIIVNYDPKRIDVMGDFTVNAKGDASDMNTALSDGVEYSLSYEYSVAEENVHAIRLMAILRKEKTRVKVSPRIRGYKLIIE